MLIAFIIINFISLCYIFFAKTNILQKQYYSSKRYVLYVLDNPYLFIKNIIALSSILLSFINTHFSILFLLFYVESFKNKTIKFKFTNRVKRHLIIFLILNMISLILFLIIKKFPIYLMITIYALMYWISFVFSVFIEKIILFHYINKAKNKLKECKTKIIAITGSYGKTSCKNYIYELIKDKYNVLITNKSYNTLNGILLTINNYLKPYHEYLILEIGVDEVNGMNKFIKHFKFDIGLITCIGHQHIKTFKGIDNIAKEKIKLLYNCKECVVINEDDKYLNKLNFNIKKITCSINKNSFINVVRRSIDEIDVIINNNTYSSKYYLLGKHNLNNLALSIGVAKALNIDDVHIISHIERLKNVKHRLSLSIFNNWKIIDDSYNSNINGFLNALDELNNSENLKILITPGIIENKDSNKLLIDKINNICDLVLLTSNFKTFDKIKNKMKFNSFIEAFNYLKNNYMNTNITLLIENDIPEIFLR